MHVLGDIHDVQDLLLGPPSRVSGTSSRKDLTKLLPTLGQFRLCRIPKRRRRTQGKNRRSPVFLVEFVIIVVVAVIKDIQGESFQVRVELLSRSGCDQISILVSGEDGGPQVLAGKTLLHKMGAVAPNCKLIVSPRKLHFVEARTAH